MFNGIEGETNESIVIVAYVFVLICVVYSSISVMVGNHAVLEGLFQRPVYLVQSVKRRCPTVTIFVQVTPSLSDFKFKLDIACQWSKSI